MNKKQMLKMAVDILMTLSLLLLMAYELVGQAAHEVIGTAMALLLLLHHALNRSWSRNILKGGYTPYRAAQTLLVALNLVLMLSQAVSGVLLSRHLYTFLPIRGYAYAARSLHMLGAYWSFVLMGLHLGLHWPMVLAPFRRALRGKESILRAAGAAAMAYGIIAFLRRGLAGYLLGQVAFAFFDFEEPLAFFLLDYLAIMGLLVWLGHYLGILLRRFPARRTPQGKG